MIGRILTCAALGVAVVACSGSDSQRGTGPSDPDVAGSDVPEAEPDVPLAEGGCTPGVCAPDDDGAPCPACADLPPARGTSCSISGAPPSPSTMQAVPAFPNLVFDRPVHLTHAGDGSDRLFVVEKNGRIRVFANDPTVTSAEVFLDIRGRVDAGPNEAGLLSVAFHPDYATNGRLFVNYTASPQGGLITRVSEFHVSSDPNVADESSEIVLHTVDQPWGNHNGGQIAFGPDGYLYIGHGDGGSAGDPLDSGQTLSSFLGKMLRIDVDSETPPYAYGIPNTNPFFDSNPNNIRPEIYAWGLRNPWRFSFDRLTGKLWAGDVGQDVLEYVHIVEAGRNYGWNIIEGTQCFSPKFGCDKTGLEMPILEYDHGQGRSITGGFVYRGESLPQLFGAYVYGDYVSGNIWAARPGDEDDAVEITLLMQSDVTISSFGEDEAGELYLVDFPYFTPTAGGILKLQPVGATPTGEPFPLKLSQTGCFEDLGTMKPSDGLIPYTVNSSLWHDGADSERYLVLPAEGRITPRQTGGWEMPEGTRLIKTFTFEQPDGTVLRTETRFVVFDPTGVQTWSYRWNEEQTEATLLSGAAEATFEKGGQKRVWHYPSRSQCRTCHNEAAGRALGWHTGQLNRDQDYGGVVANQLFALEHLGALDGPTGDARWADPGDTDADLGARARASLATNCGTCHVADGPTPTPLDLRYETPLSETVACDVAPEKGNLGIENARLIAPGEPERSTLWVRMTRFGDERMPSLGSFVTDQTAVDLIEQWIRDLEGCE